MVRRSIAPRNSCLRACGDGHDGRPPSAGPSSLESCMAIHIQRAHVGDLEAVVALNADVQAFHVAGAPERYHALQPEQVRAYFDQLLRREDADIALLVEDGEPLGYVICLFVEKPASPFSAGSRVLYVDQIGIKEGRQRRGL